MVKSVLRMHHYATYFQSFDYDTRSRKSTDHANPKAINIPDPSVPDRPGQRVNEADVIELNQIKTIDDRLTRNLIPGVWAPNIASRLNKSSFNSGKVAFSEEYASTYRKHCAGKCSKSYNLPISEQPGQSPPLGMDHDIEEMVSNCADSQSVRLEPAKPEVNWPETSTMLLQWVHVDFAGPFQQFLRMNTDVHRTEVPYHPTAFGKAEQ